MPSDVVISIKNVDKKYRRRKQRTMKELLQAIFTGKSTTETFWVLKDLNLEVKKGQTLGILGPNGAGKSTLLKLLAGVIQPEKGIVKTIGRVAPLIELGAGFHSELTGRENVYLNGIILGMKRKEVDRKFKEIVDFAELWDFIDEPVKHYSSGMYLRLGFAVAVHTDPDILLVDEILAVGDKFFKKKCFAKWNELRESGVTSIFISHDMNQIKQFCDSAAFLENCKLDIMPNVEAAIKRYEMN